MANLEATLASAAKAGPSAASPKYDSDTLHRVALDLLDDNPWQPRSTMDEKALEELVASLRAQGLIQSIAVKPTAAGRFIIVAGHRRVAAFRRLREEAKTESERLKWSLRISLNVNTWIARREHSCRAGVRHCRARENPLSLQSPIGNLRLFTDSDPGVHVIPIWVFTAERCGHSSIGALMKVAIDDGQLAAQAYMENVNREALTPLDEARALEAMVEKGLAKTNDELATLLQQNVARVKRLRRLFTAPAVVKDAVASGLMVCVGTDGEDKEKKELRRLDLHAALSFVRLHESLRKTQPRKADERTERAVRRALAGNWSLRRCDDFVDGVVAGREEQPDADGVVDGPVFSQSPRRFAVDLGRLRAATKDQRQALRVAFESLLAAEEGADQR